MVRRKTSRSKRSIDKLNNNKEKKSTTPQRRATIQRNKQSHIMLIGNKAVKISAKILREIRVLQQQTNLLVPKLPFARLVQEVAQELAPHGVRFQSAALMALQEAAEIYLVQFLEDSYSCALHARRVTLLPRDMALVQFLRRIF